MFDWPEQTQTSPTSRLFTVTVLSPVIFIVRGPPSFSGFSFTLHLPSAAVVLTFWLANSTVTFSPSRAVPQTGTGWPRCRTAPSVNSGLGFTSACSGPEIRAASASPFMEEMDLGVMGLKPSYVTKA